MLKDIRKNNRASHHHHLVGWLSTTEHTIIVQHTNKDSMYKYILM